MTTEPLSESEYYEEGQDLGHENINDARNRLTVAQSSVVMIQDKTTTDAAGLTPSQGESWVVAATPSPGDAWEGHENDIATYRGTGWIFRTPTAGQLIVDLSAKKLQILGTGSATDWEDVHTYT
jgi:hypothetical protein